MTIESVIMHYERQIKQLKAEFQEPKYELDPVNDHLSDKINLISGFIARLNILKLEGNYGVHDK